MHLALKKAKTDFSNGKVQNIDHHLIFQTVLVDQGRLMELQVQLKTIILLSSALLTTFSSLSPDLASQQALVTSLKQDLFDLLKPDCL